MNFVPLPKSEPTPEDSLEWLTFRSTQLSLEELAVSSVRDFMSAQDSLIAQAIWSPDWQRLNVREVRGTFAATARYMRGATKEPQLIGLFVLPLSEQKPPSPEVHQVFAEFENIAQDAFKTWDRIQLLLQPWRENARGSKTKRPASAYAALALRYVQLVESNAKNPRQVLSDELGVSLPSVSARVREARTMGFITESTHGRAEGEITPMGFKAVISAVAALQEEITN